MGYIKKKIGDISNVPYVTFECDTVADVAAIDVSNVVMGSRCYVVDTGATYALNSNGEWKEVPIGGGASSWNDLEDKPFYEETVTNVIPGLNITWDGNTSGLPSATMGRTILYRVSELTPTLEQLQTATVVFKDTTGGEDVVQQLSDATITVHNEQGLVLKSVDYIAVQYVEVDDTPPGLYFPVGMGGMIYCSSITAPEISETVSEVKTIDKKFLPGHLQFGEETTTTVIPALNISWDGAMEGDTFKVGPMSLYRVYDIPPLEQLQNAVFEVSLVSTGKPNGDIFNFSQFTTYQDTEQVFIARLSNLLVFAVVYDESYGYPTGLYLSNNYSMFIHSVTAPAIENTVTEVKTIDPKYLPQTDGGGIEAVHLYLDSRLTNASILHNLHYGDVEGGNYARFDEAIEMTKAEADELYNKWIRGMARIFVFESSLSNGGSENFFEVVQLHKQSINSTGTYYDIYGTFMRFGEKKEFKLA